jgi:hypothetical protein
MRTVKNTTYVPPPAPYKPAKLLESNSAPYAILPVRASLLGVLQQIADGRGNRLRIALKTQNANAIRDIRRALGRAGLINTDIAGYITMVDPLTPAALALLDQGDEASAREAILPYLPASWELPTPAPISHKA